MSQQLSKITWTGISGTKYSFHCHPIGTNYLALPGVYIFCKKAPDGFWDALYVGECDLFCNRIDRDLRQHHKFYDVTLAGATHICTIHVDGGNAARLRVETDLRHGLQPPFNDQ